MFAGYHAGSQPKKRSERKCVYNFYDKHQFVRTEAARTPSVGSSNLTRRLMADLGRRLYTAQREASDPAIQDDAMATPSWCRQQPDSSPNAIVRKLYRLPNAVACRYFFFFIYNMLLNWHIVCIGEIRN